LLTNHLIIVYVVSLALTTDSNRRALNEMMGLMPHL